MEESTFNGCTELETVTFGENSQMQVIEKNVFSMAGIKKLEIPASLKRIDQGAFWWVHPQEIYFNDIAAWCNVMDGNKNTLL